MVYYSSVPKLKTVDDGSGESNNDRPPRVVGAPVPSADAAGEAGGAGAAPPAWLQAVLEGLGASGGGGGGGGGGGDGGGGGGGGGNVLPPLNTAIDFKGELMLMRRPHFPKPDGGGLRNTAGWPLVPPWTNPVAEHALSATVGEHVQKLTSPETYAAAGFAYCCHCTSGEQGYIRDHSAMWEVVDERIAAAADADLGML